MLEAKRWMTGCVLLGLLAACGGDREDMAASPQPDPAIEAGDLSTVDTALPPPTDSTTSPSGVGTSPDTRDTRERNGAPALTARGWGPLVMGMSRAEIIAAAGPDANPHAVGGPEPEICDVFRPDRMPEGMLVMVEADTLTRITVSRNADVLTPEGLHVGSTADEVRAAYGPRVRATLHHYVDPPAEYLTIWEQTSPDSLGFVYEVGADATVTHIHAGTPSIRYIESCL